MNVVHKKLLSLIRHSDCKKISCAVGADDESEPIYAVIHKMTSVDSVDRPHIERVLEILGSGDINCRVDLEFLEHDVLVDYSSLPLEYFVSVTRRSDDVSRWISIEPNDDGDRIRGASVMTSVNGIASPKQHLVHLRECAHLLNFIWTRRWSGGFAP